MGQSGTNMGQNGTNMGQSGTNGTNFASVIGSIKTP